MSNELDKQFSDRLLGYESAVDAEALWQAVKPPRKRRPLGWWWLLVGGLTLLSTSWWYWNSMKDDTAITSFTVGVEAGMATTTIDTDVATYESEQNNASVLTKTNGPAANDINNLASASTKASSSVSLSKTSVENVFADEKTPDLHTAIDQKEKTGGLINTIPGPKNSNSSVSELVISTENDDTPSLSFLTPLETVETFSRSQRESAAFIPNLEMGLLPTQINTNFPLLTTAVELSPMYKPSPWFLQLEAGYYALQRTLGNSDSLAVAVDWVNKREQTESLLEANSLDITIGYNLTDKWEIRSGLAYTQINTAFNYTNSITEVDSIEGLQVIVFQGDTVVDSVFGPIARYTTTVQEKRTYNSFRQWEVPLLLAYNFGSGKLHYQAEAGVRLLLQRQWEGNIINTNDEFVDLETKDWYRNSLGLSFQAGIKAVYDLNAQTSLLAGFSMRYNPQQFTIDYAPFKEQYQLLGVSIGLRHNF